MKSIGARLAICYVLASTITFASLFSTGRFFVERHAISSLDLVIQTEFEQIRADTASLGPSPSEAALRQTAQASSFNSFNQFLIEIYDLKGKVVYRAPGLRDMDLTLPPPRLAQFNVILPDLGEMRAGQFSIGNYTVVIATSKRDVRVVMNGYERTFYRLLLLMIAISSVIGYGFSRMALRPLRLIQDTANRIRSDNLSERIPVSSAKDEISSLARLLNQMFDRLEESFDQIRRFTAEASHELKTPLTLVRLQAEKLIVDGNLSATQEQAVHVQLKELSHLHRIIEDLLFLSRADARAITLDLREQDPEALLQNFSQDADVLAESHEQHFVLSHEGRGTVSIESKWIRQVLLNLLSNALAASPPGSRIVLRSTLTERCWQVRIEDQGPGVPAEQRERIFERFVRLNRPGKETKGTGLGLAICRGIINLHGGRIFAEAGPGDHGLAMIFEIPALTVVTTTAPRTIEALRPDTV